MIDGGYADKPENGYYSPDAFEKAPNIDAESLP